MPPWPLDVHGIVFGEELGEHTRRRLLLERDEPDELDEPDGDEWWSNPDGSIALATCEGVVGIVNLRSWAVLDGVDVIGASRAAIVRRLGRPAETDDVSVSYDEGRWTLQIGLLDERVGWVALFDWDVLDHQ